MKDKEIVKLYTDEAIKIATDNHNEHNNTVCQTMCNAEQRLLGEIVQHKGLSYSVMQPMNEGLFNRNGFHTHGYKSRISNNSGKDWHCAILNMIKKCDLTVYSKLINHEWFKEEKEYMKEGYEKPSQLKIYR